MKKILILGGTGIMGRPLVNILLDMNYEIFVTSRAKHESNKVNYIQGNAHDLQFLNSILEKDRYDAIVDFMSWRVDEFQEVVKLVLKRTVQYVFLSSARVYAESKMPLTESSDRLLDVCEDREYLASEDYALSKAREEDVLINSKLKNWTIVRPSITYNYDRLQLVIWEKEEWLYRVLNGRSIVFPSDLADVKTAMSYGEDVAVAIAKLICNSNAIGEIVHIADTRALTWKEVLDIYVAFLEEEYGKEVKVYYIDSAKTLSEKFGRTYQLRYARGISREFNGKKLENMIGKHDFTEAKIGLTRCLEEFISSGTQFKGVSWKKEALFDRITGERAKLNEFGSIKNKVYYLFARYMPSWIVNLLI